MEGLKNMGKDILKLTTEVAIDIDGVEASVLDNFILRFPDVAQDIFKELDNETVTKCRNVSRLWCDYLDDQKFCWVRMIQRYHINFGKCIPRLPTMEKSIQKYPCRICKRNFSYYSTIF